MEVVSELLFFSFLVFAYFSRHEGGIPLPIKESCQDDDDCWKRMNVWKYIVGDGSNQEFKDILMKNLLVWSVLYTTVHILTYVEPQRNLFKPFKFNPNYPPSSLIMMEIARSIRGVLIASFLEFFVENMYVKEMLPIVKLPSIFGEPMESTSSNVTIYGIVLLLLWWDFHFYWTHRLLHTKWLFKSIHKVHHESYNPDPFSGLSMHWMESTIYFSAGPLLALIAPKWAFKILAFSLLVLPLGDHCGFGSSNFEVDYNHYIHHTKFNWNYGGSPIWDYIMGTNYKKPKVNTD